MVVVVVVVVVVVAAVAVAVAVAVVVVVVVVVVVLAVVGISNGPNNPQTMSSPIQGTERNKGLRFVAGPMFSQGFKVSTTDLMFYPLSYM